MDIRIVRDDELFVEWSELVTNSKPMSESHRKIMSDIFLGFSPKENKVGEVFHEFSLSAMGPLRGCGWE